MKLGFNHDVYWNRYIAEMWDRGAGALHVYSDFRITSLDMQTASPPINVPFGYGRWLRGLGNYVAYLSANGTELHIISSVASGPGRTPSNA
ncbi:MAG: hypothetical protein SWK76_05140 [Actinomycetota bacterium]|nr:hypothetical protein [Actinomycetota bacterium]